MNFNKIKRFIATNLEVLIELETNSIFRQAYIKLRNDLLK